MKRSISQDDVERYVAEGRREIQVRADTVVTAAAEEAAARLGLRIVLADGGVAEGVERRGYDWDRGLERWRAEFPFLKAGKIHVANCSQSPISNRVRAAVNRYMDSLQERGMDWEGWLEEVHAARAQFAKIINASVEEIALSTSVSEAVASIASALDFRSGRDKVVTTEIEFPTVGHVWLGFQKYGARVEFVPKRDGMIRLEDYDRYLDERTLITSVAQVYYETGFRQDLAVIAEKAHARGSLLLVDAYQGLGTTPVDVKAMDIDFLVSGNLKYLLGVPGIAFTYVRRELIPRLRPAVTGWLGRDNPFAFEVRRLDWAPDARRLDTGTPPVPAAFAAKAGMEIINEIGTDRIARHCDMLSQYAIELADERGLLLASPRDIREKGAITALFTGDRDAHEVEVELMRRGIVASARGRVIRIAHHFFTAPEDLERVFDALAEILTG